MPVFVCFSFLQAGVATDRLLAILDSNGDLYLARHIAGPGPGLSAAAAARTAQGSSSATNSAGVITASGLVTQGSSKQQQRHRMVKLATHVTGGPVWHSSAPMLAAVVDGQLVVWYHPGAAFVDHGLLQATRCIISTDR